MEQGSSAIAAWPRQLIAAREIWLTGPRVLWVRPTDAPGARLLQPLECVPLSVALEGIDHRAYDRFCRLTGKHYHFPQLAVECREEAWLAALACRRQASCEVLARRIARRFGLGESQRAWLQRHAHRLTPRQWLQLMMQEAENQQELHAAVVEVTASCFGERVGEHLAECFDRCAQASDGGELYWRQARSRWQLDLHDAEPGRRMLVQLERQKNGSCRWRLVELRSNEAPQSAGRASARYRVSESVLARQADEVLEWVRERLGDGQDASLLTSPQRSRSTLKSRSLSDWDDRVGRWNPPGKLDYQSAGAIRSRATALGIPIQGLEVEELRAGVAAAAIRKFPASCLCGRRGAFIRAADEEPGAADENERLGLESVVAHALPAGLLHPRLPAQPTRLREHLAGLEAFRPVSPFAG